MQKLQFQIGFSIVLLMGLMIYQHQTEVGIEEFEKCLGPTQHCQSHNKEIVELAEKLSKNKSKLEAAEAIFHWVQHNIKYEDYYNSKHGAVGCLEVKHCNCCDQANLLNALFRAAGLPAKYEHGECKFHHSGKSLGHVWTQVYVDSKWHICDTTSEQNSFGVIKSWSLVHMKGESCELTF